MLPSNGLRAAVLFPLFSLTGCYAAVGPTVGIDLPTGRATLGLEASGATFTVAQSFALGSRAVPQSGVASRAAPRSAAPQPKEPVPVYWTSRTSLLWEPGLGLPTNDARDQYGVVGAGGTLGMRIDRNDDASTVLGFSGGGYVDVAQTLTGRPSDECQGDDVRPYIALVIGIRARELYLSPKVGVLEVPRICLFGSGNE